MLVVYVGFLKNQLKFECHVLVFDKRKDFLCLHGTNISSLELSVASFQLYMIQYFSRRHNLQFPVTGL